jgi:hypothetical protein
MSETIIGWDLGDPKGDWAAECEFERDPVTGVITIKSLQTYRHAIEGEMPPDARKPAAPVKGRRAGYIGSEFEQV